MENIDIWFQQTQLGSGYKLDQPLVGSGSNTSSVFKAFSVDTALSQVCSTSDQSWSWVVDYILSLYAVRIRSSHVQLRISLFYF